MSSPAAGLFPVINIHGGTLSSYVVVSVGVTVLLVLDEQEVKCDCKLESNAKLQTTQCLFVLSSQPLASPSSFIYRCHHIPSSANSAARPELMFKGLLLFLGDADGDSPSDETVTTVLYYTDSLVFVFL